MRRSLTLRLSVSFALLSAVLFAAAGYLLDRALEAHLTERDTTELAGKLELVRHILAETGASGGREELKHRLDDALTGHHMLYLTIYAADGAVVYASSKLRLPDSIGAATPPNAGTAMPSQIVNVGPKLTVRALAVQFRASEKAEKLTITLAIDIGDSIDLLYAHRRHIVAASLTAILLSILIGWTVARSGLRELSTIAERAAEISSSGLGKRLVLADAPVELKALAMAFNAMLARLEDSFLRLSDFSSDLAHELRTPLNNLIGLTQVTLSRPRGLDEYARVLASNLEEMERLNRICADMLFLAKADHAQLTPQREPVDLRREADKLAEFFTVSAAERGITIECTGAASVQGDRLMIQRAMANLVSNAVRHADPQSNIRMQVDDQPDGVSVTVENTGRVIDAVHLPRLFDRFYCADSSRSQSPDSTGLGLAIVQSIMKLHGGTASVMNDQCGATRFKLEFPPG